MDEHARHQGEAGEVAFKDGRNRRHGRLAADPAIGEIKVDNAIDQLEILKAHRV